MSPKASPATESLPLPGSFELNGRYELRPLLYSDAAALQDLLRASSEYFFQADGRRPASKEALSRISEALGDEQQQLWGVWQGKIIVALLDIRLHHPEPELLSVALLLVRPEERGRKLGSRLVEELEGAAKRVGYAGIFLGVQEGQHRAHNFWSNHGFEPQEDEEGVTNYLRRW